MSNKKFPLGMVAATRAVANEISSIELINFLNRHSAGDWGNVCEEDKEANEYALDKELRLFSIYKSNNGEKVYVITEADRSSTAILYAHEY